MTLPYNEELFNRLHKELHDKSKKQVTVNLSNLFKEDTSESVRREIIGAIQRVARRIGFRTIVVRHLEEKSIMEFYRYDYAN